MSIIAVPVAGLAAPVSGVCHLSQKTLKRAEEYKEKKIISQQIGQIKQINTIQMTITKYISHRFTDEYKNISRSPEVSGSMKSAERKYR